MAKSHSLSIFLIIASLFALTQAVDTLPPEVISYMATREMRHHHLLWHNVRNSWLSLDNATQQALEAIGWGCPRPSQNTTEEGKVVSLSDNDSGEDFLYMHRQMLLKAQEIASGLNPPVEIVGWKTIPASDDTDYPVPPEYDAGSPETTSSVRAWKSNNTYWNVIKGKEAKFKSPKYLRNVTLGQMGSHIEYELHNGMHIRWSTVTEYGLRPRPPNPVPKIDPKWDIETYDWLIDSYSSHVNPFFYNLHLWIDDRIQDWMAVNNVTELEWKGTWVGGPVERVPELVQIGKDHNLKKDGDEIPAPNLRGAHDMHNHNMGESDSQGTTVNVLEEVMEILSKAGVKEYSFYDPVFCEGEETLPSL